MWELEVKSSSLDPLYTKVTLKAFQLFHNAVFDHIALTIFQVLIPLVGELAEPLNYLT